MVPEPDAGSYIEVAEPVQICDLVHSSEPLQQMFPGIKGPERLPLLHGSLCEIVKTAYRAASGCFVGFKR
jgi:hypothetical protein